jgi:hypothetical protein
MVFVVAVVVAVHVIVLDGLMTAHVRVPFGQVQVDATGPRVDRVLERSVSGHHTEEMDHLRLRVRGRAARSSGRAARGLRHRAEGCDQSG